MKQLLLVAACLLIAIFLLPGGMASWGEDLTIDGMITIAELETAAEKASTEQAGIGALSDQIDLPEEESSEESFGFMPEIRYVINLSINGRGSTIPQAGHSVYKLGEEVVLVATPLEGWVFCHWAINGEIYQDPYILLTMEQDYSVSAHFRECPDGPEKDSVYEEGQSSDDQNASEVEE